MVVRSIPVPNLAKLKRLDSRDHDNTLESKEAKKLENKLLIEYNAILTGIKNQIDFTATNYMTQFDQLKSNLKIPVYDITRSYYQQAYELGSRYVNNAIGTISYLTNSDIDHIKSQSENFTERFFGRIEKILQKTGDEIIQIFMDTGFLNATLENENQIVMFAKKIENTKSYLFSSLAILVIMDGLNSATIRKARTIKEALTNDLGLNPNILTGAIIHQQDIDISDVLVVKLLMILNTLAYRWYTSQDDRVCPICRKLEGTRYTLTLTTQIGDIPRIPDDTHFSCRCRLLLDADI